MFNVNLTVEVNIYYFEKFELNLESFIDKNYIQHIYNKPRLIRLVVNIVRTNLRLRQIL